MGAPARTRARVTREAYNKYRTGETARAMSIFHVANTSRPAILTVDAARASKAAQSTLERIHGFLTKPLAFLREITAARMNTGAFKIVPGNANVAQTINRPNR
jgi:hypothetical protein